MLLGVDVELQAAVVAVMTPLKAVNKKTYQASLYFTYEISPKNANIKFNALT